MLSHPVPELADYRFDLTRVIERVTHGHRPEPHQLQAVAASVVRQIPRDRHERALVSAIVDRLAALSEPPPVPAPGPAAGPLIEPVPDPDPAPEPEPTRRPARSARSAPSTRPTRSSPKVAAIREAWRAELKSGVTVGDGMKRLGECTAADLKLAADDHDLRARRYRRLAELLESYDAEHVAELPDDVLEHALTLEPHP